MLTLELILLPLLTFGLISLATVGLPLARALHATQPPASLARHLWLEQIHALPAVLLDHTATPNEVSYPAFTGHLGPYVVRGVLLRSRSAALILSLPRHHLPTTFVLPPHARPPLPAAIQAFLADHPATLRQLQRMLDRHPGLEVRADALRIVAPIEDLCPLEALLAQLEALATALLAPAREALQETARRLALPAPGAALRLEGTTQGCQVSVVLGASGLEVRAAARERLPTRLLVRARAAAGAPEGLWLSNPILRGLVAARGDAWTRQILADPDLTAPLLAVLHPLPGSRIEHGTVILHEPSWTPAAVPERVQDALTLARALQDAAQRVAVR